MINVRISSNNTSFEPEIDIHGYLSDSELLNVKNRLSEAMDIVERLLENLREDKE